MKTRYLFATAVAAVLAVAGCSSDSRASIATDLQTAASNVADAAGNVADNASEALARNIATQQGEEQFKNAGQELDGPLVCVAKVQDSVSKLDINCTGATKAGGAVALTGSTNEIPGASVVALDGQFTGTVDGAAVFTTAHLGG